MKHPIRKYQRTSSTGFRMSERDALKVEMVALMRKARIRGELIYAYLRTGLMVTEENHQHLSPKDLRSWEQALSEYAQRRGRSDSR